MEGTLNKIESLANTFAKATDLYRFYQRSELVKISVALSEQFLKYSQSSDEYDKKHITVDINDFIARYKTALKEIGIDSRNFSW